MTTSPLPPPPPPAATTPGWPAEPPSQDRASTTLTWVAGGLTVAATAIMVFAVLPLLGLITVIWAFSSADGDRADPEVAALVDDHVSGPPLRFNVEERFPSGMAPGPSDEILAAFVADPAPSAAAVVDDIVDGLTGEGFIVIFDGRSGASDSRFDRYSTHLERGDDRVDLSVWDGTLRIEIH